MRASFRIRVAIANSASSKSGHAVQKENAPITSALFKGKVRLIAVCRAWADDSGVMRMSLITKVGLVLK